MSEFPVLKFPPIVEAVFEIKVILPQGDLTNSLKQLHERFSDNYPKIQEQRTVEIGVKLSSVNPQASEAMRAQRLQGFRFLSQDGKQIVQCKRDGFAFNQLAPYDNWEEFSRRSLEGWRIFSEKFPSAIKKRIGLRYINKISVPFEGTVNVDEYLHMHPPDVPVKGVFYTGFLNHSKLLDPKLGLKCNWILTGQPATKNVLPLVLDIDVFDDSPRLQEKGPEEIVKDMRLLKNRLFFGTFTPKGLDLFNVTRSGSSINGSNPTT